jgi:membrane protease YdiL (CAAX protease family)
VIRQDGLSFFFFAFASAELAFNFLQGESVTAGPAFGELVAMFLLIFGLVGWLIAEKFQPHAMPGIALKTSEREALNIGLGVVLALFLFILSNKFVPALGVASASTINVYTFFGTFTLSTASLGASFNAFLFVVVLIPTAEENFFRGFWANLSIAKAGKFAGILFQAIIFMLFHIPAYGWTILLGIIFADGLIIGAIDEQTGRLSTGILAHSGNNFLAFLVVAGSSVGAPLMVLGLPVVQLASVPLMLGVYGFVRYRRGLPVLPQWRDAFVHH